MIYTRKQINEEVTSILTQRLAEGWTLFVSREVAGHQGEIFKICLKKDDKIGVIFLDSDHGYNMDRRESYDFLQLVWGVWSDSRKSSFWLKDVTVIEEKRYFLLGHGYCGADDACFADVETAMAADKKGHDRLMERQKNLKEEPSLDISNPVVRKKVVDIVRRRCKGAKWMTYKSLSSAKLCHDRAYGCDRYLLKASEVLPTGGTRSHLVTISETRKED